MKTTRTTIRRIATIAALLLATAAGALHAAEPTEAQMLQAINNHIAAVNRNIEQMSRTPDSVPNNPFGQIQVLVGGIMKGTRFYVGGFRKIAASPASDGLGYACLYDLQLRATGNAGSMMDSLMQLGGSRCLARFVETEGGWVWIPPQQKN